MNDYDKSTFLLSGVLGFLKVKLVLNHVLVFNVILFLLKITCIIELKNDKVDITYMDRFFDWYNKYRMYLYIMYVCVNKYSYDLESSASNNV